MKTGAHFVAVFRVAQGAGANGNNFFDAEIFALLEVAFENR